MKKLHFVFVLLGIALNTYAQFTVYQNNFESPITTLTSNCGNGDYDARAMNLLYSGSGIHPNSAGLVFGNCANPGGGCNSAEALMIGQKVYRDLSGKSGNYSIGLQNTTNPIIDKIGFQFNPMLNSTVQIGFDLSHSTIVTCNNGSPLMISTPELKIQLFDSIGFDTANLTGTRLLSTAFKVGNTYGPSNVDTLNTKMNLSNFSVSLSTLFSGQVPSSVIVVFELVNGSYAAIDNVKITVNTYITYSASQPTCGTPGSVQANIPAGFGPCNFRLTRAGKFISPGVLLELSDSSGFFNNLGPGNYTVTAIDRNGNLTVDTFTIHHVPYATNNLAPNDNIAQATTIHLGSEAPGSNRVNWDDPNHAVNHKLYSAVNPAQPHNSTIQKIGGVPEPQPFSSEFGQDLAHSSWFKIYVPNIACKLRLFTQIGNTYANARTAIAVYKQTSPIIDGCMITSYNDIAPVPNCQSFEKEYINIPSTINSFHPILPVPNRYNGSSMPAGLMWPDPCTNVHIPGLSLENFPKRSYIEFMAEPETYYYIQVFSINPKYNPLTFIDANLNHLNQCYVDDRLYISVDLEPRSNIHGFLVGTNSYKAEINRAGSNNTSDPSKEYRFYSRSTAVTPSNICTSLGYNYDGSITTGSNKIATSPTATTNLNYWASYLYNDNTSTCSVAQTLTTRIHNFQIPATKALKRSEVTSVAPMGISTHWISVSPNPANAELNIIIDEYSLTPASFDIININGQVVSSMKLGEDMKNLKLNIGDYVKGVYIIRFSDMDKNVVKSLRFIKN